MYHSNMTAVKINTLTEAEIRSIGDASGYLMYLEEHGFIVRNAKQLASTIPMMYVESTVEKI